MRHVVAAIACLLMSCRSAKECPPCPPSSSSSAAPAHDAAVAVGPTDVAKRVLALMQAGDAAGLHALFNEGMKAAVPRDQVAPMLAEVIAQRGKLTAIEALEVEGNEGSFRLRAERGEWRLELTVDDTGAIASMQVAEPVAADKAVAKSDLALVLPFRGDWSVLWGGDTKALNQHLARRSQRRATDLLVKDDKGVTHSGDGAANADYFAYGKEVLAVAAGRVVTVVDGVPDNQPGKMNVDMVPGNVVIIEHRPDLYSAYAHLVPGSMVKVGQAVKQGQIIGKCGNSGNSSEAHLHFQLQDGPRFEDSWGIEPVFSDIDVTRDGVRARLATYTWRKGDRVHGK